MKDRIVQLTLVLGLFVIWLAQPHCAIAQEAGVIRVATLLQGDGRIRTAEVAGTVDVSGFDVSLDPHLGPIFSPTRPASEGWNALGTSGLNSIVYAIAVSGGNVYVGGSFFSAGGITGADYIARWDGNAWHALGAGLGIPSGVVYAIAVSGNDVYVGGSFVDVAGNVDADYIVRWDGFAWSALGTGLDGSVNAIAVGSSGVYVAGDFQNAGGNASADRIARWDGGVWNSVGGVGLNNTPRALAINGNKVYVGGDFLDVAGIPEADRIAVWDGAAWSALGGGVGNTVLAIATKDNDVYVGGNFVDAGGNANADYIARWDGSGWNALGTGTSDQVQGLTFFGNDLYVAGAFADAGGVTGVNGVARWSGTSWNALGSGLDSPAFAVAHDAVSVFVGGFFMSAGGVPNTSFIARWEPGGALPVQLASFTGTFVNNSVHLHWRTISEINNFGFYVQRKSQGQAGWTELTNSFIAGHGTTNDPHDYAFVDNSAPRENLEYRLRQMDLDGTSHYTDPISVGSVTSVGGMEIPNEYSLGQNYPNPFNPSTTIEFALPKTLPVRLEVFNALGQKVAELVNGTRDAGYYAERLDATGLASGIYLYRLQAGEFVQVRKLMVLK